MRMRKIEFNTKPPVVRIAFIDVGQGDSIVISSPETHEAIIVDCVDANSVIKYLITEQIIYLRGVIITHLHADHYAGVATLLNNYHKVSGIEDCEVLAFNEIFNQKNLQSLIQDSDGHSSSYEGSAAGVKRSRIITLSNLIKWRNQNKSKYALLQVQRGALPFEGTLAKYLDLLHPYAADFRYLESLGLNNTSVVLRINGPNSSALLTGDLEPAGWQQLQKNLPDLRSDVLKFPHHGAWKDADAGALLDSINPSIVIMSVGTEGEKYKHPNSHVFAALAKRPYIHLLCTQATDQCQAAVRKERTLVVSDYEAQSAKNGQQLIFSRRGCPCAGTVVIELGEKAHVLQPEIKFHRNIIIEPHFKAHKCTF